MVRNTLGSVTLTPTEISGCCQISDVDVIVYWSKTAGSCAAPTSTGYSYHKEVSFTVNGPASNQPLAISCTEATATWNGGVSITSVTTRFTSGPAVFPAPSGTPVSGTFSPDPAGGGNLNLYNNTSAMGAWSLTAGDATNLDPLLVDAYQIEITTQTDNTEPSITVPSTITVNTDPGICTVIVSYTSQVSATDLCGVALLLKTGGIASGSTFPLGTSTVEYTATDVYGTPSTPSFSVDIDGATSSYYCPLGSGNYHVVITDANGCTVSSIISEYTYDESSPCATGIDEHGLILDVYPNPWTGLFSVKYSLETQKDMKLTVFDLLGKQVTDNVIISSQNGTSVIDFSNQADGIYTLRIELEGDKVLQQRLVLVK